MATPESQIPPVQQAQLGRRLQQLVAEVALSEKLPTEVSALVSDRQFGLVTGNIHIQVISSEKAVQIALRTVTRCQTTEANGIIDLVLSANPTPAALICDQTTAEILFKAPLLWYRGENSGLIGRINSKYSDVLAVYIV